MKAPWKLIDDLMPVVFSRNEGAYLWPNFFTNNIDIHANGSSKMFLTRREVDDGEWKRVLFERLCQIPSYTKRTV
jgi:hypothetical protein